MLNEFFCSVFTRENDSDVPAADSRFTDDSADRLTDVTIDTATIADRIRNLKPDKAAGDDNLSPRLLKCISSEIIIIIIIIFFNDKLSNATHYSSSEHQVQIYQYRPNSERMNE